MAVYYSGHGLHIRNEGGSPSHYQSIVPYDFKEDGEFRGIISLELSHLAERLSNKTKNVTVIFDCCHAARMSRDEGVFVKALPENAFPLKSHVAALRERGMFPGHLEGNPHTVRMMAALPHQQAYEVRKDGARVGLFTWHLVRLLHEARGMKVSWERLGTCLREAVLKDGVASQHVEAEGSVRRLLFSTEHAGKSPALECFTKDNKHYLHGGGMLGVKEGDRYAILPRLTAEYDAEKKLADAVVLKTSATRAQIDLEMRNSFGKTVLRGEQAFPMSANLRKYIVETVPEGAKADKIRSALLESAHLTPGSGGGRLAQVRLSDDLIHIYDENQQLAVHPVGFSEENIRKATEDLEKMARIRALREFLFTAREGLAPPTMEWGLVKNGERHPFDSPASLCQGDSFYVRICNTAKVEMYVSIFDIGVSGKISLLSSSHPSGVYLPCGEEYVLGEDEFGILEGIPVYWPDTVPQDAPRKESLMLIASDSPQDLRVLESDGTGRHRGEDTSRLQQMIAHVTEGGIRDAKPPSVSLRYNVRWIDFQLAPDMQGKRRENPPTDA